MVNIKKSTIIWEVYFSHHIFLLFTYCVLIKKNHQPPEFRYPLSQLRHLSLELDSNHCGEFHRADVEEGDVLMFPSYLHHSVHVGKKTEYPRITISFNCVVNKYGEEVR